MVQGDVAARVGQKRTRVPCLHDITSVASRGYVYIILTYLDEFEIGKLGATAQTFKGVRDARVCETDAISNVDEAGQLFQLGKELGGDVSVVLVPDGLFMIMDKRDLRCC